MSQVDVMTEDRFRKFDGPSVVTRRNFGLIRGKTLREARDSLAKTPTIKRNLSSDTLPANLQSGLRSTVPLIDPVGPTDPKHAATVALRRAGAVGRFSRASSVWEWPLGEAEVINCDDYLEVLLQFSPFLPSEVSADVMGNELVIQCKTEIQRPEMPQRELFRCYTLPLNINSKTAEFKIVQEKVLKVCIKKAKNLVN